MYTNAFGLVVVDLTKFSKHHFQVNIQLKGEADTEGQHLFWHFVL